MDHGKSANSAAKTLRVLHAVARLDSARKLSEIAEESGIPKATTHRLLGTLIEEGYVVPEGGGSYGVGPQLRSMAAQVLADDTVGIESTLRALQQRLGQAVHLAVLGGEFATYTHKVEPGHAYRIATGVGMPVPLHASAAGKALLAYLPPAEAATLLDRAGLPERTPAPSPTADGWTTNWHAYASRDMRPSTRRPTNRSARSRPPYWTGTAIREPRSPYPH